MWLTAGTSTPHRYLGAELLSTKKDLESQQEAGLGAQRPVVVKLVMTGIANGRWNESKKPLD